MKCRISTERLTEIYSQMRLRVLACGYIFRLTFRPLSDVSYSDECQKKKLSSMSNTLPLFRALDKIKRTHKKEGRNNWGLFWTYANMERSWKWINKRNIFYKEELFFLLTTRTNCLPWRETWIFLIAKIPGMSNTRSLQNLAAWNSGSTRRLAIVRNLFWMYLRHWGTVKEEMIIRKIPNEKN